MSRNKKDIPSRLKTVFSGVDKKNQLLAYGIRNNKNGDVSGYRLGSDLWLRRHVNDTISPPFLISVRYTKKHRDGNGPINLCEVDDGDYNPFNPNVNLKYNDNDALRTLKGFSSFASPSTKRA